MTDHPKVKKRPVRKRWVRYVLAAMKQLAIPVLCVLALLAGLIAGYVVLGGQPLSDVWKIGTWKHVFDLVFADA